MVVLAILAAPTFVFADGRVALVVGNSTYAHIGRLPNPDNDARDMSAALRRLGFEVTTEFDADRVELTEALRAFTRRSAGADISLVFYAGHGIEMDGVNYLVPVDARLERDVDVRFETVTVDDLLVSTSGASLRLVLLDACRNNPLARSMQRTAATRTVSGGSFADLNEDLLGDETLVAYAAAAGTTAADGRGRNSPYTAALLSHLETPLEIGLLFRRVRAEVLAATNGAQRPHEYHSLVGEHYLTRTLATGTAVTVAAPVDPPRLAPPEIDISELHLAALHELAEAGDAEAQTELGERYEDGRGVVQDSAVAVSWFRRAAEQGHAPGQAALGFMYERGRGVAQDYREAILWFRRAAEQGHAGGQNNLGLMYGNGRGVAQDYGEAVLWFRRAAEQGHAGGQNNLGLMYGNGRGVAQDYGEAVLWFRRAAAQGHAGGQYNFGVTYERGLGVRQDDAEAVRWFHRSAEQGHINAHYNLGVMYRDGRGVSQDYEAAVGRFRRAAAQGHVGGQANLGWCYENGRGVQRDRVEAVRWYRRAADQGNSWAQRQLDRLSCPMCPELVVVPAGKFQMGCVNVNDGCDGDERPVHEVEVASFAVSKYEVTREQFAAFVSATGHNTPGGCASFNAGSWHDQEWQRDDHPVVCVNWDDVQAYLRWLSTETGRMYRLLSEAEWEYAARGGTTTAWYWGNNSEHRIRAWEGCRYSNSTVFFKRDLCDRWIGTAPVGSFPANAFGLHDMSGNVWEWVEDCWHGNYRDAPTDGSAWTHGGNCGRRVVRGGGWDSFLWDLRSADRRRLRPGRRWIDIGFRVAMTLD